MPMPMTDAQRRAKYAEKQRTAARRGKRRAELDPAVALYRQTVAEWKEKGRVLNGTSGRCPIVSSDRQKGPRQLLQVAV